MRELDGQHATTPRSSLAPQQRHLSQPPHNALLQVLPAADTEALVRAGEHVVLRPRQIVHHWNMEMEYAYFIEQGLVSVFAKIDREKSVEVWLTGCDGMIGIPTVLGHADDPTHRRVVQVGGSALRIPMPTFRHLIEEREQIRALITRYTLFLLMQASQLGACNSHHRLKQRLARWILQASDALEGPDIRLTHALLGRLLGVRRASVTDCLSELEREGLVKVSRGSIAIADREALLAACCDCYRIIRSSRRRLVAPHGEM